MQSTGREPTFILKADRKKLGIVKAMLDKKPYKHQPIALLAASVFMGRSNLVSGFKRCYGMGLYAYLLEQRMKTAAELLIKEGQCIKQVAHAAGYRSSSSFCKAFRKRYGTSPSAYRRLYLNW